MIQDIILELLLTHPFYGYVASQLTVVESDTIDEIEMIYGPTVKLIYNKEWYSQLPFKHKKGLVIHQLLHLIFLHPFRQEGHKPFVWSVACDMAVNSFINDDMLFEDAITVKKIAERLKALIPEKKSAEFYYDFILNVEECFAFSGSDKDVVVATESHLPLKADQFSDNNMDKTQQKAFESQLVQTFEECSISDELPPSIEVSLNTTYEEYRIKWRTVLKRFLIGKGRMNKRKSYKRQSRRFENLPGTKRSTGVRVLLAIDESGSISNSLVESFHHELKQLNRIIGADIWVTRFDTECMEPEQISKFMKKPDRLKNGGTDFRPIFELADAMKMHQVIVFTDGDGEVPSEVNAKVLWVLTKGNENPSTFGHVITFDEEA